MRHFSPNSLCSPTKHPYPPHGKSSEIPRGRGVLKAKFVEAMYENKLEFPGEREGYKTKNLPWGEYGYFLELDILFHACGIQSTFTPCHQRYVCPFLLTEVMIIIFTYTITQCASKPFAFYCSVAYCSSIVFQ